MDNILMQAMTEKTEQSTDEVLMSAISKADKYDDILMHYGVDGMHWYERRYQNLDGSLTPLGRIHYGIGKARAKRAEKKIRKAEKAEADRVKKVEKLARSGNVDKIYKNRALFTREEMADAVTRAEQINKFKKTGMKAQAVEKLKTLAEDKKKQEQSPKVKPEDIKKAKVTLDSIAKGAKAVVGVYTAYNTLASAVNMTTGEKTLPQLDAESFRNWKAKRGQALDDVAGDTYTNVTKESYKTYLKTGNRDDLETTRLGKNKDARSALQKEKDSAPKKDKPSSPQGTNWFDYTSPRYDISVGPDGGKRKVTLGESAKGTYDALKQRTITDQDVTNAIVKARLSEDHSVSMDQSIDNQLKSISRQRAKDAATQRYRDTWTGTSTTARDESDLFSVMSAYIPKDSMPYSTSNDLARAMSGQKIQDLEQIFLYDRIQNDGRKSYSLKAKW